MPYSRRSTGMTVGGYLRDSTRQSANYHFKTRCLFRAQNTYSRPQNKWPIRTDLEHLNFRIPGLLVQAGNSLPVCVRLLFDTNLGQCPV